MFKYKAFDVDVIRQIDNCRLRWPARGEASSESGLGCNREYIDLRYLSWSEARQVLALEADLIARIEAAQDSEEECEAIADELLLSLTGHGPPLITTFGPP